MRIYLHNWIKRLQVIASLAFNVLQLTAALIALLATAFGAAIVAWFLKMESWIAPLIAFALGIVVTIIIGTFFFARANPPRWLIRGYKFISVHHLYKIHEDDLKQHSAEITYLIEAAQPGVSMFEGCYLWTGRGEEGDLKILSQGQTMMWNIIQKNAWKYYYIYLGHELNVGEKTEVKVGIDFYDAENKFEPYLAKTVTSLIDQLTLSVILPKNHLPSHIVYREWNTIGPASSQIRRIDGKINHQNGEIIWKIQNPSFGHRYEIRWEY